MSRKRIGLAGLAVVVIVVLAVGGKLAWSRFSPIPGPHATVTYAVLDGQRVVMAVPPHPNGQLILWAHGHGDDADEILTQRTSVSLRDALLKAGYTLAGTNGHGNAFGNNASIADLVRLDHWASQAQPITGTYLVGESMGGLASLLVLPQIPDLKGWIGVFPVCNLSTVAPAFPDVGAAYGVSNWVPADSPGRSPVELNAPIFRGLPMLFLASNDDTVVSKTENTDRCAAQARSAGANVTVIATQGDHGDSSNFRTGPFLNFLSSSR